MSPGIFDPKARRRAIQKLAREYGLLISQAEAELMERKDREQKLKHEKQNTTKKSIKEQAKEILEKYQK
jgi:hypothetical protein